MNLNELSSAKTINILSSFISSAPYGIIAIDVDGNIIISNKLTVQYLNLNCDYKEITKKHILECVREIPVIEQKLRLCLSKERKAFNVEAIPLNGKYLSFRGRIIQNGFVITIENITRLKEMESANLNAMIEIQEQEQNRLAKEIHDGLGPLLSTVKLNLEAALSDLENDEKSSSVEKLQTAIQLIDSLATEMRSISHALMPAVLEDFGLVEALENLCAKINKTNKIHINFLNTGINDRFDRIIELGLYRICQELINNALKHSNATIINVQLIQRTDGVVLMVEDNGRGFDIQTVKEQQPGIGLKNIESRITAIGGEFYIDSSEGKGVTATVEIPNLEN